MNNAFVLAIATTAIFAAGASDARTGIRSAQVRQTCDWQPAAAYPGPPTWFSAAFTIGDKAFLGTGYDFGHAFRQYDAGSNTWTPKADFPGKPRGAAIAFSIGDKGYIGTGFYAETRFTDLWEYDPSADRWTTKAPIPGRPRDHASAFVVDRRAYVAGGMTCDGGNCPELKEVWQYEPRSNCWTRKADMPEAASAAVCFVLNGKAYLVSGRAGVTFSKNVLEYDPQTDRWTRKAAFPGPPRARAVGFSANGKGCIATGMQSTSLGSATVLRDIWEYDASSDAWTQNPDLSGPARGAAVAFVVGCRVFIGTGVDSKGNLLGDFWWIDQAGLASAREVLR